MIIQGDSLDELKKLPDAFVDAVICDPPYCSGGFSEAGRKGAKGQGLRSDVLRDKQRWFTGDNMGTAGLAFLLRNIAIECQRIIHRGGHFLMFLDWRMVYNLAPAIESAGFRFQNLIVWDKGSAGLGTGFRPRHEMILHMTNGKPEFFNKCVGNVIQAKRVNHTKRQHPTEKPVDLLEQLLKVTTPEYGIVLDPFCGSGSMAAACKNMGREFIGIDRDPDFCEVARSRE